jgi:hypothetical protein
MSSMTRSGWDEEYPRPRCRGPRASGVSATVAIMALSYGVPSPTGSSSVWRCKVLGWVSTCGFRSSEKLLPAGGIRLGGVTGQCGDVLAGVAGRAGRGLRGGGVKRPPNRPLVEGGVGKISVCAGVRRQVA